MNIKRLLLVFVISILLFSAVPIAPTRAQAAEPPVVVLLSGDLWSWSAASGTLKKLTNHGFNKEPVISPDNAWVAYNSWADVTVQAINNGMDYVGDLPSNIWLWNVATGQALRAAPQPPNAAFGPQSGWQNAVVRSTPSWSFDGTKLVWCEVALPDYAYRLATYDLKTGVYKVIVPNLPMPFQDAGLSVPRPRWGAGGIATQIIRFEGQGQPIDELLIHDENGKLLARHNVGVEWVDWLWVAENEKAYIALLGKDAQWQLLDPLTGKRQPMNGLLEMYSLSLKEPTVIVGAKQPATGNLLDFRWQAAQGQRWLDLPLKIMPFQSYTLSIAPDGQALAFASDALYIWRNEQITKVPGTQGLIRNGETGVAWGAVGWRVRRFGL